MVFCIFLRKTEFKFRLIFKFPLINFCQHQRFLNCIFDLSNFKIIKIFSQTHYSTLSSNHFSHLLTPTDHNIWKYAPLKTHLKHITLCFYATIHHRRVVRLQIPFHVHCLWRCSSSEKLSSFFISRAASTKEIPKDEYTKCSAA